MWWQIGGALEVSVDVGLGVDHLLYASPLAGVSFGKKESKKDISKYVLVHDVIVHNFIIRIFTQDNPSVHCTVINGVLHIELN